VTAHASRDRDVIQAAARRFESDAVRYLLQAAQNWRDTGDEARARRCEAAAARAVAALARATDAAGLPPAPGRA